MSQSLRSSSNAQAAAEPIRKQQWQIKGNASDFLTIQENHLLGFLLTIIILGEGDELVVFLVLAAFFLLALAA